MALRAFDFADLPRDHAALRALPDSPELRARLHDRMDRGPVPSCAAAVLAELGDSSVKTALSGAVAYLDRPDLEALATLGATDAVACVAAASSLPAPVRQTAVEALSRMPVTSGALAVLTALSDRERDPVARLARTIGSDMSLRSDMGVRAEAERLRTRAVLGRSWTGIRRQELQREVAVGALLPCVALLTGDPTFLAGLVPPIADEARPALVPAVLAAARGADDAVRAKLFGLLQARFRDAALESLSLLARFVSLKARDARIPLLALERLAALGSWREVIIACVSGGAEVRVAALTALSQAPMRSFSDRDRELADEAVSWLAHTGDAAASQRLASALARA